MKSKVTFIFHSVTVGSKVIIYKTCTGKVRYALYEVLETMTQRGRKSDKL